MPGGALAIAPPAGDGRTVDVLLVKWDTPHEVSDDGRIRYVESFARGGLTLPPGGRAYARNEHDLSGLDVTAGPGAFPGRDGEVVGRITEAHVRSDGLYGTIRIADNEVGRRLLGLMPDVLDTLSIEFDDVWRPIRAGEHVVRSAAILTGVAFTLNPQRGDARVLAVRTHLQEHNNIMDTQPASASASAPAAPAAPAAAEPAELVSALRSEPAVQVHVHNTPAAAPAAPAPAPHQRSAPEPGGIVLPDAEAAQAITFLRRFRSFGEFCKAAAESRDPAVMVEHQRALGIAVAAGGSFASFRRAQEVAALADVAGLLPPTWLTEVIDLVQTMAPTPSAWGSDTLPDTGTSIAQPIVGDRPTMAAQTEGAEVASNKVTVTDASWTVGTFGGGQEMSMQVMQRTSPQYLSIVMRLYLAEAARLWNATVAAGLYAAANDVNTTSLEFVDGKTFPDLVVDASKIFLAALGRPAEVVALSVGLWGELGKAKDTTGRYMFPDIAAQNAVGTFDLTSAAGQLRRIAYYVEPSWSSGNKGVIGVREAYRSLRGPLQTLNADTPSTLSHAMAVYFFGAHGAADASGLVQIADAS